MHNNQVTKQNTGYSANENIISFLLSGIYDIIFAEIT